MVPLNLLNSLNRLVLGQLPKKTSGTQYLMILTNCYSKLANVTSTGKMTAATVFTIFLNNCLASYGNPARDLTNNNPYLTFKVFKTVCVELRIVQLTTAEDHPQSNGKAETFKDDMVSRLSYYFSEQREDWKISVTLLTYAHNKQVHRSKNGLYHCSSKSATLYSGKPIKKTNATGRRPIPLSDGDDK